MFDAQARWERIASGLFWTGWLFVALMAYGIYAGDGARSALMNASCSGVLFALWYFARARAEYLLSGDKPPLPMAIASSLVICGGIVVVVYRLVTPTVVHEEPTTLTFPAMDMSQLEEVDMPTPNGPIRSLRRKPPADCVEWAEIAHPNQPGTIRYCARRATP